MTTDMISAADAIPEVDLLDEISRVTTYRDRLIERHWKGIDAQGTWPRHCLQRAFCDGASWWQFHHSGWTLFPAESDECEQEAIKRYGVPRGQDEGSDRA